MNFCNYKFLLALLMSILIILVLIKLPDYVLIMTNIKKINPPPKTDYQMIQESVNEESDNNDQITSEYKASNIISLSDQSEKTLSLPGALVDNNIENYASF